MSKRRCILPILLLFFILHCCSASRSIFKRQVSMCENNPCGWLIYDPVTRRIIESRPNPSCRCDKSYQRCLKTQMDVSISAYVYRCLPSSPPSRIDSTPEAVNNL